MSLLDDCLRAIHPVSRELEPQIQNHLDHLAKPPGSLGRLEEIAARYCLIRNTVRPQLGRKRIFTFASDHGVTEEGISAYPAQVTPQMVRNMLAGGAAVNVLARHAGSEVCVIDIGVNDPLEGAEGLIRRKVRPGTANIAVGPAMTEAEARQAVEIGIDLADRASQDGITLLGTGEMGIGNTTPSAALFAALLGRPARELAGRGTGINEQTFERKVAVIETALRVNRDRLGNPLTALAAVGGPEIAGICGLILGAAAHRLPVVVDGYISSAGALAAVRMIPAAQDYLFFSHCSAEAGHKVFFRESGIAPLLDLNMRLGEGTGAALAMLVIEGAVKIYNEMATFQSAGVSEKGA